MGWYIRSLTSPDGTPYKRLEDAVAQMQNTINVRGKSFARSADGRLELREPDGSLFDAIWIENEDGRVMRF